ncbi:ABC transporter substrate-binding protein [Saccharopolyspora subtropica]|uniref:ABC transporter substrate-binding protein n=1 Tax=Saccharopolyspora thermophila TaxID=89367 RepID=A0A917JYG5_9PSEU|nr:ABC transporter substrate-binding protein [Saccharopolyspora subtropica]GGI88223.1 ABC transporter substrate-binding protein [Saccharopolyspora subtropica]
MANYVERTWWQQHRMKVLAVAAVVLLLAGGGVFWVWQAGRCAAGVDRLGPDGECIGISDGSFEFHPMLADVQRKIKEENDWVLAQGRPYVSIVYLAPMTLAEGDTVTVEATRNALRGAYIAQLRANHDGGWEGDFPLIRLLPANPGTRFQQWEPVVERIRQAQHSDDRVVAVAGLGQSHEGTARAIERLAEYRIPMVGATITADVFTEAERQGRFTGLMRVAPSNTEQVRAMVRRLAGTRRAMLVQDANQSDLLANNLAEAFNSEYPRDGRQLIRPEIYDSSLGTANTFPAMVRNICAARPDAIFFSGRYRDLALLMGALKNRPCPDLRLRVLALDSVVDLAGVDEVRRTLSPNTTLEYTHLSTPRAWDAAPWAFDQEAIRYFRDPQLRTSYRNVFRDDSAGDGMAIASFDAVGVTITAIRRAAGSGQDAAAITAETVAEQFHVMHGSEAVPGASGWLSFDATGHPEDKALSVFTLSIDDGRSAGQNLPDVVSASGHIRTHPS